MWDSAWLLSAVENCHLLALGLLGGTIVILNLRLLGLRFQNERIADLATEVRPWMVGSLAVMLVPRFFLFSSEAVKMYGNGAFRIKMAALALAVAFTVHRKMTMSDEGAMSELRRALVALVSLTLWAGVGLAGRAIGYV